MEMMGKRQLDRQTTIDAPVTLVYRLFMDNAELHNWAPPVNAVIAESGGDEHGVGRTRTCDVSLQGRSGTMVEQCVDAVADTRAAFVVVDDSFGFGKMFANYGFTVEFAAKGERTIARMQTFYTPTNLVATAMNLLLMRRKFRATVDGLLEGLRALCEDRHRARFDSGDRLSQA